jgi:hypothetical protein
VGKANKQRGEGDLALAGKAYRLRPSHDALEAIEDQTGKSIIALARMGNRCDMTLRQVGIVGAELIRAGAEEGDSFTQNVEASRISELAIEEGLHKVQPVLTLVLMDAATGGRTSTGEAKAVPAKPTNQPAGAASPE